jgi:DNA-binding response OmpR family regulator
MTASRQRALIVDDSRTIAAIMRRFLELQNFEVLVAADGALGLEVARREQPRVIITDVNMPGMGGLDMVRALRNDERTRDVVIIMQTSDASDASRQEAIDAGANDYIVKPFEPARLAALLKAAVERPESASRG